MEMDLFTGLSLLGCLAVKHFIFDYPLQSMWMITNKGTLGHPGGLAHAGLHGLGTGMAFGIFVAPEIALLMAALDFMAHYTIDYVKSNLSAGYTPNDKAFWNWMGADQLAHTVTYLGLVGLAAYGLG